MFNSTLKKEVGTEPLNKLQFGGQVGLGFDFWRFTLDFKYDFSGTKYNSTSASNSWWKQNIFDVSLGFKIIKN